ncbi:MAG: hypothetical protein ABI460_06185 [Caldimonas sp.]
MHRTRLLATVLLFGAATAYGADPLPPGPAAIVADTANRGSHDGGTFFVLAEVDGKSMRTAIDSSLQASRGRGNLLSIQHVERPVAASRLRLKLLARVVQAAPIIDIFSSLKNDAVEGVVEVELQPDVRYRVTGTLDAFRREVWLEEEATQRIVGDKVVQAPSAAAAAQMAQATTFTCCNLRYDDDWIGDAAYSSLPFVPAGSKVRFVDWGRNRANVLIEGRKMSIGVEEPKLTTREQYFKNVVVNENPAAKIDTWPADVQAAVRAGKVMAGMTREQVIVSLGYPRADATPSLDAPAWTYWGDDDAPYSLVWGDDGRVRSIEGAMRIKQMVMPAP